MKRTKDILICVALIVFIAETFSDLFLFVGMFFYGEVEAQQLRRLPSSRVTSRLRPQQRR